MEKNFEIEIGSRNDDSFDEIALHSMIHYCSALVLFIIFINIQPSDSIASLQRIMGQTITTTQFFLYGKKNFTRTGYLKAVKSYKDPVQSKTAIKRGEAGADGVDLNGKVIVVTGANSGIGKEMATYAAAKGANVYMLCRSKDRAEAAKEEIIKLTSNESVKVLLGDMGELEQVRTIVSELQNKEPKIDCLVCNAGVLLNDRRETHEGNEVTLACHLLGGSFLLSTLLTPQLKAAGSESRVVFISSGGMYNKKFPGWECAMGIGKYKDEYEGNTQYAYAKRGQVLLAEYNTKHVPEIAWVSAHPGWTSTPAVEEAYGDMKKYLEPMRSPWEGAEGICWLMSTKRDNLQSGAFYLDRTPQRKHLAGPFFSEGSSTKNSEEEVDAMVEQLKKACGL